MPVYLIHSTVPVGGPGRTGAQHYLGYCRPGGLASRLEQHRRGRNTHGLVKAFLAAGGKLLVTRVWRNGDQAFERRMKRNGQLARQCPICNPRRPMVLPPVPAV